MRVAQDHALRLEHLANGLTVGILRGGESSLVAIGVCYRAGTRHESPGQGGAAHFLEHMMFRGSPRFGPGEVDRRTQVLGGDNNAFTSHDCSLYYFTLASDRWTEALEMEADRMTELLLLPEEIEIERSVILEEIDLHEADPWDALEQRVFAAQFQFHPYGRPVLGSRESVSTISRQELLAFHERFYSPDNAVIVVAGDVPSYAFESIAEHFGQVSVRDRDSPPAPPTSSVRGMRRVSSGVGETLRLLIAFPGPSASDRDFAPLCLAVAVLGTGRASRLQRNLVEERQLCASLSVDVTETVDDGAILVAAEVVPGVEPAVMEAALVSELSKVRSKGIGDAELDRARAQLLSDRVLNQESVQQRALTWAQALALHGPSYLDRHWRGIETCSTDEVHRVVSTYLDPERPCVIGWSTGKPGGRDSVPLSQRKDQPDG